MQASAIECLPESRRFGKEGSAHLDGVRSAARDSRLQSRPQQRRSLEAGRDAEQQ